MPKHTRTQTKHLAVGAMLTALGVILLSLGTVIEVLDLSLSVIASLLCVYAVIELRGPYPWLIYASTALLSLLLLPQKTPALIYALFSGFYPILKAKFEARSRVVSAVCKLVTVHLSLLAIYGAMRIFLPAEIEGLAPGWLLLGLYALLLVTFLLYDHCLTRLITFYLLKLQKKLHLRN